MKTLFLGATSILATFVPHGGRAVAMLILKRHGRGTPFLEHDTQVLSSILPAVGLADAGFQFAFDAALENTAGPLPSDGLDHLRDPASGLPVDRVPAERRRPERVMPDC